MSDPALVRDERQTAPVGLKAADTPALADWLTACGFDAQRYLADHPDLLAAGLDAAGGRFHFLMDGLMEERRILGGPLPTGLDRLAPIAAGDPVYAVMLFRAVFLAQLRNPQTAARLWQVVDPGLIAMIRGYAGLPFIVMGDSHAQHYRRPSWVGGQWLAPLVFVCPGVSAAELASDAAPSASGQAILDWARGPARRGGRIDVPIILKFGGMDAEFAWTARRIRDRAYRLSMDDFDEFARTSVAHYSTFVDRLAEATGRGLLRVASVFPATLGDAHWVGRCVPLLAGSPDESRRITDELSRMELSDLRTRTQMRVIYNSHLQSMCASRGLRFIDDFWRLLGPDGVIDPVHTASHGGAHDHVDLASSEAPLLACILEALTPPGAAMPFVRRAPA
jgi:hypothetical protein